MEITSDFGHWWHPCRKVQEWDECYSRYCYIPLESPQQEWRPSFHQLLGGMANVSQLRSSLSFALCWRGLLKVMLPLFRAAHIQWLLMWGYSSLNLGPLWRTIPTSAFPLGTASWFNLFLCPDLLLWLPDSCYYQEHSSINFLHINLHLRIYFLGLPSSISARSSP